MFASARQIVTSILMKDRLFAFVRTLDRMVDLAAFFHSLNPMSGDGQKLTSIASYPEMVICV